MHAFVRRKRALVISMPVWASLFMLSGCGPDGDPTPSVTNQAAEANGGMAQAQSVQSDIQASATLSAPGWVAYTQAMPILSSYASVVNALPTYYVDDINGRDNDPLHDGKSPERAWKTLSYAFQTPSKVADAAVLLRCGGVWRESITTTGIGAAKQIGAYVGTGDTACTNSKRPRIKGTDLLSDYFPPSTSWSKVGSTNAYERPYQAQHDRLFLNGVPIRKARHPNGANGGGIGNEFMWKTEGTGTYNSFYIDKDNRPSFEGSTRPLLQAKVYIRTNHWTIERASVTAYDPATGLVTVKWTDLADDEKSQQKHAAIAANSSYFFEGKAWMVDSPDEWAIDIQNKRIVVWLSNEKSPSLYTKTLEVGVRKQGVLIGYTPLTKSPRLESLRLEGFEEDGIVVDKAQGTVISNVQVLHAGRYGISAIADSADKAIEAQNIEVRNSYVEGAGKVGIFGLHALNFKSLNNWVVDTGLPNRGESAVAGIKTQSSGAQIQGNTVQRASNGGIFAESTFDNVVVTGNTVIEACMRVTDCGGIYTGGNTHIAIPQPSAVKPSRDSVGSLIQGNMVVGTRSATDGFSSSTRNLGMGIYLDFRSSRVKVLDNIISGAGRGIMLHNAVSNLIDGNVVRQVSGASLTAGWDTEFDTDTQKNILLGNVISNNAFMSEQPLSKDPLTGAIQENERDVVYAQTWHHAPDWHAFFEGPSPNEIFGNNTLVMTPELADLARQRPLDDGQLSRHTGGAVWRLTPGTSRPRYSEWMAGKPGETMSMPVPFKPYRLDELSGELLSEAWSPSLQLPVEGKVTYPTTTDCDPNQQLALQCPKFTMGHEWDALNRQVLVPLDLADNNNSYVLRFSVKTTAPAVSKLRVAVRLPVSPLTHLGFFMDQIDLPGGESLQVEQFFNAKNAKLPGETSSAAMLQFGGGTPTLGQPLFIQKASLVKAKVLPLPTWKEVGLHVVNLKSASSRSISCTPADTGISGVIDCANVRFGERYEDAYGVIHQPGELVGWPTKALRLKARSAAFLIVGGTPWRQ